MKLKAAVALVACALPFVAGAQTVSWTQWTPGTTASGAMGAVSVQYTGEVVALDYDANYFSNTTSFTNAEVSNTPGANGAIRLNGATGSNYPNHLHFSAPVTNPYIAMYSVGQGGTPATFDFRNGNDASDGPSITLLSQGPGNWGGGTLSVSGHVVTGEEGNGIVRLNGTFSDVYFWNPNYENYYGFTVGMAAVPEPSTYAMLLLGLGVLGWAARRRT
jgi:hypothetical protein